MMARPARSATPARRAGAASTARASALASSASRTAAPTSAGPPPSGAKPRRTPPAAMSWSSGRSQEDLADFEQRDVGKAAIGIASAPPRRGREQARPHVGEIGGDRIGERERGLAAAEHSACALETNDQVTASTMPRAASARLALAGAQLNRGQHRLARRCRRARTASSGTLSTPRMRTISSTMSALPCTSGRQEGTATLPPGRRRRR